MDWGWSGGMLEAHEGVLGCIWADIGDLTAAMTQMDLMELWMAHWVLP